MASSGYYAASVAEATDLPIILYSIPSRCSVEIGVPLLERLRLRYSHIAWIKEAGGSVERVDQITGCGARGFHDGAEHGDDLALTLAFMAIGGRRASSASRRTSCRVEIARMVHLAQGNDFAAASKLHRRLFPLFKALFIEPNPVPLKAALARAGVIGSEAVRLPLCAMELSGHPRRAHKGPAEPEALTRQCRSRYSSMAPAGAWDLP